MPKEITANRAAVILDAHVPGSPVALAWHDLARDHLADLRRIGSRIADTKKRIATAVKASCTTLTSVLGDVADVSRFPTADRFASYNGTAPIEVSSGSRKIFRLSRRGDRRLNHVIHRLIRTLSYLIGSEALADRARGSRPDLARRLRVAFRDHPAASLLPCGIALPPPDSHRNDNLRGHSH